MVDDSDTILVRSFDAGVVVVVILRYRKFCYLILSYITRVAILFVFMFTEYIIGLIIYRHVTSIQFAGGISVIVTIVIIIIIVIVCDYLTMMVMMMV